MLLESLPTVRERAAASHAWLARVVLLLDGEEKGSGQLVAAEVRAAKPLMKVDEVAAAATRLSEAVRALDAWLDHAARLFLRPGELRQLLAVLRGEGGTWPPSEEETASCCPCCSPGELQAGSVDSELTWVGCDGCEAWFHASCVDVPEAAHHVARVLWLSG